MCFYKWTNDDLVNREHEEHLCRCFREGLIKNLYILSDSNAFNIVSDEAPSFLQMMMFMIVRIHCKKRKFVRTSQFKSQGDLGSNKVTVRKTKSLVQLSDNSLCQEQPEDLRYFGLIFFTTSFLAGNLLGISSSKRKKYKLIVTEEKVWWKLVKPYIHIRNYMIT